MKKLLFMLLAAVTLVACDKGDNPPSETTLSVDPPTPILFTAAATETFPISVTTNQPKWKVESSQSWCKVVPESNKFTVSAEPNTLATVPTPAVITVTAGDKSVTINVTQQSAGSQYPTNETELKQAISKVWIFPEDADYISLEFTNDNTYTLLSKKPVTRATADNIYLLSGTYTIADNLREFTLSDFGQINITSLGNDNAEIIITPTGGTASTVKLNEQKIAPPPTTTDKKIKKVESIDPTEGNTAIEYDYTDGKLSKVAFSFDKMTLEIPIKYEGNKVSYQFESEEAIGKPGVFKITYNLNSAGLAQSSVIEHKEVVVGKTYYTYNNQRQLISYRMTDKDGKFEAYCNATWVNGNVVSVYVERSHTCDDSYDEYEGTKYYHHDHNGNGVYDENDRAVIGGIEKHTYTYSYSDKLNKGGYMHIVAVPEIFSSSDFFDQIGQWTGVLGVSYKNLIIEHEGEDGNLSYTFDSDGYPTRIDVSYPEYPSDNWYVTQKYE